MGDILSGRSGYDPDFLGSRLDLPEFTASAVADVVHPWFTYQHFSLAMSHTRRFARVTAVNVDGQDGRHSLDRPDRWWADPRLPVEEQVTEDDEVYGERFEIDRGHLVRREDPLWGGTEKADRANRDTHFFTNCTPQHARFNRDMRKWRAVEEYILRELAVDHHRVVVFTGPLLRSDDPEIAGVAIPLDFWKIIATAGQRGQFVAVAFLFSQRHLIEEGEVAAESVNWLERVRAHQVPVANLEQDCELDFGGLRLSDPLHNRPAALAPIALRSLTDIVIL